METLGKIPNKLNLDKQNDTVEYFLPENYYLLRAIMCTIENLQNYVGQTIAIGACAPVQIEEVSNEVQQDTWALVMDLAQKIKVCGDTLELTILDELQRYKA